jgi:uncharacterized protein YcfJ
MKRSNSGKKRSFSTSSRSTTKPVPQQSNPPVSAQPQQGGGLMGNLVGGMVMGAGVGAGSEIAHSAIGGLMGDSKDSSGVQQQTQATSPMEMNNSVCNLESKNLKECLVQTNNSSMTGPCQQYFEMLKMCYDANRN